jgi:hypothetical protein
LRERQPEVAIASATNVAVMRSLMTLLPVLAASDAALGPAPHRRPPRRLMNSPVR